MFILFEDSGKYLTGRTLSATDAALQVELATGKRLKVKKTYVLLNFNQPSAAELEQQARTLASEIDLDLTWEFAPESDFGFAELAREYYGEQVDIVQQAAMAYALFGAPHYFRRVGKGRFKKAPAEVVAQALAAIAKRKQLEQQIDAWAQQLSQGNCPVEIRQQKYKILFKPDKNSAVYKAVVKAVQLTKKSALTLFMDLGLIDSAFDFHWQRFLLQNFPQGYELPLCAAPIKLADLTTAPVKAYSIDDALTTEIDDALSLQQQGDEFILGIHIAAPSLAIAINSELDKQARQRMSTMYMPGYKITMLPASLIEQCSLDAGAYHPAVSLYLTFAKADFSLLHTQTKVELVWIEKNLRLNQLDYLAGTQWLAAAGGATELDLGFTLLDWQLLYRLAEHLYAQRMLVRGVPEKNTQQDFNFVLAKNPAAIPTGAEIVTIQTRARGGAVDLIVAESMILANKTWGKQLADSGVPGIYRYQLSMQPGIRVKMGTKAMPHAAMGVECYAWCTSPLRRYVDFINQQQLLACIEHGNTAALVAAFKPKDADLYAIVSSFETVYSTYRDFQKQIERFWTLRYLQQQNKFELIVSVLTLAENGAVVVKATELPLIFTVANVPILPQPIRGKLLAVQINHLDLFTLEVNAVYLRLLEETVELAIEEEEEKPQPAIRLAIEQEAELNSLTS